MSLAPDLLASVDAREPRNALRSSIAENRDRFSGDDEDAYDHLGERADDVLVTAVGRAFKAAFLITGGLALLGALALVLLIPRGLDLRALAPALVLAALAPVTFGLVHAVTGPEPVTIADPCQERDSPDSGGVTGLIQDEVLKQLDDVACENGSSREELVLALADDAEAEDYERRYGTSPRSFEGILDALPG